MDIQQIFSRYNKGESLKDLASEFGVHQATLFRKLKKLGLKREKVPDSFFLKVHEEYLSGLTVKEISEKYQTSSPATIWRAFKRLNLKTFDRKESALKNLEKRKKTFLIFVICYCNVK